MRLDHFGNDPAKLFFRDHRLQSDLIDRFILAMRTDMRIGAGARPKCPGSRSSEGTPIVSADLAAAGIENRIGNRLLRRDRHEDNQLEK